MRAALFTEIGAPLSIENLEPAPPGPKDVVVQLGASGVCHSDLSVQQMKLPFPPPVVLGHEGAGTVEEVGKDVKHLKPGDHVVLSWVENCGRCHHCIAGHAHLCDAMMASMMSGGELVFKKGDMQIARMAGVASFSERTVVRGNAAIKIPDDMPLDRACLVGCGVMTGVGAAVNTAKVQPGDTVAVFGCGGVGLNAIQGAALCGASRIIGVDLAPSKLELAKVFGATDVVNGKDGNAPDQIRSLTGGLGVDFAFEVIGLPSVVQQAYLSLKRGGKAIIVGVIRHGAQLTIDPDFLHQDRQLLGCTYGSANMRAGMPQLVDLYRAKKLKLDELVSRTYRLEEINTAFAALEHGEVARSIIAYQ
jgi:S-(hydroxymethyl)glutathione dehydrogenase/alcohol dehydrogenase